MAYEKQTWQSGDVITAAKMNHIEDGIAAGGVFIVNATKIGDSHQYQLDKTYNQIYSAVMQGKICYIKRNTYLAAVNQINNTDIYSVSGDLIYRADSADGILIGTLEK